MTPQRWQEVKSVLDHALDHGPSSRSIFLDEACDHDQALREEVESLLERETELWDFLDAPLFSLSPKTQHDTAAGSRIGPYQLEKAIGQGGMGTVYLAHRLDDFEKRVAIKLLRRGMDSDEIVRRFRRERQILAQLEHPNIARLLDGGSTDDGLPYFVIEYVDGEPIDRYCATRTLSLQRKLRLFQKICDAVQAAHQRLIVHRDLKPANILITADGEPKLLDFGIAKLLTDDGPAETLFTQHGLRLLTPGFASPEQIRGEAITTASDVYALGVLLYSLLTDKLPHDLPTTPSPEALLVLCEQDPDAPSNSITDRGERRRLRGDLDAIALKALRKSPEQRYPSATALARDVQRHLDGFPVQARQGTTLYRARRYLHRNRIAIGAASLAVVIASGIAAREWQQSGRLAHQLSRSEAAKEFLIDIVTAGDPENARGQELTASQILELGAERIPSGFPEQPELRADLSDMVGRAQRNLGHYEKAEKLLRLAVSDRKEALGAKHPDVAVALDSLASLLQEMGRTREAEDAYLEATKIQAASLPSDNLDALRGIFNYANFLTNLDRLDEAEPLAQKAAEGRRRRLGESADETAVSRALLGRILNIRGQLVPARAELTAAIRILETHRSPLDLRVLSAKTSLATVEWSLGNLDAAEALLRESVDGHSTVFGPAHGKTSEARSNLAFVLHEQGELDEATALYRVALAQGIEARGDDHWRVAVVRNNLGAILIDQNELDEAQSKLEAALAAMRAHLSTESRYTAWALRNLARAQSLAGEHDAAIRHAREAVEIQDARRDRTALADAKSVLGGALARSGQLGEARPLLLESLQVLQRELGPNARKTREAHNRNQALLSRAADRGNQHEVQGDR